MGVLVWPRLEHVPYSVVMDLRLRWWMRAMTRQRQGLLVLGSGGVQHVRARALGNPRSQRLRVLTGGQEGIKGPALLHRVCVCTGTQHCRGRSIAATLAELRRSRAAMASGGNGETDGDSVRLLHENTRQKSSAVAAHVDSTRASGAGRRSPWVDGEGVAGAVWTRGTTTHGSAAAAWLGRRRGRSYGSRHCSSWPSA